MLNNYKQIIEKQKELNDRIRNHKHFEKIRNPFFSTKSKSIWIAGFLRCLRQELNELNEDLAFKHWKNVEPDWEHAKEEWIDCLHFFISIFSTFPTLENIFIRHIIWDKKEHELYKRDEVGIMLIDKLCLEIAKAMELVFIDIENFHDDEDPEIVDKFVISDDELQYALMRITMNMSDLSKVIFEKEEDIYEEYLKKNKINNERVDNGY